MVSFFDHPFYKWNKIAMSVIGTWPEQHIFARCLIPTFICANVLSMVIPEGLYLKITWPNIDAFLEWVPPLCIWVQVTVQLLNVSFQRGKFSVILDHISSDWDRFGNSHEAEALRKCAAHGFWITKTYYRWMYSATLSYLFMPVLMPKIVEVFVPSNGSEENVYLFNTYYGVNSDDYYWFLFAHGCWESFLAIVVMVTNDAMFFVIAEHSCALFKVVEINLERICFLDGNSKDSAQGRHYNTICHCINLHGEAITFTTLIDSAYNGCMLVILGASLLELSVTQLQILMHLDEPGELIRFISFASAQVFRLYLFSVPGQKILDHSSSICNSAYSVDWHNLKPRVQKLFILIMIRSQRPCVISAGSVYTITMENFSSILQTAMSFFTVLSSMR
ncbi:odorant receptor 4-like [Venturia canescens]|uniref:odorant receptor 4-like n=1 Tax=Venturia canescens TaxID=32260 RepID=UPI001C9C9918|nr:odorant receptor 4-like [Venturia canescens]